MKKPANTRKYVMKSNGLGLDFLQRLWGGGGVVRKNVIAAEKWGKDTGRAANQVLWRFGCEDKLGPLDQDDLWWR